MDQPAQTNQHPPPADVEMTDGPITTQTHQAPPSEPTQTSETPQQATQPFRPQIPQADPQTAPEVVPTPVQAAPASQPPPQTQPVAAIAAVRSSPAPLAGPPLQPIPNGAPARVYLNQMVTPHLLEGMKHLAVYQPEKPLEWLGEYLSMKSREVEGS